MCEHVNKFKTWQECNDCLAACEAYRAAIREIPASIGAGQRWASSVHIHRYACGACEVYICDFDFAPEGQEVEKPYVIDITPEIELAFNAAISAATAARRHASGKPDDNTLAMGWHNNKSTLAQVQHARKIAALARKRKSLVAVKAEIYRLYEQEGCKWEFAVATALKSAKLPRAIKAEIADSEEWEKWIEAYAE